MNELTSGVSWIAVIVGFFAAFMLGWFWYSPAAFGKKWAAGVGVELADGSTMPVMAMVSQALGTFTLAWLFGITAAGEKLLTIILVLITIILLIIANGKYVQKSNTAIGIEAGYTFTMGIIMLICQAIF